MRPRRRFRAHYDQLALSKHKPDCRCVDCARGPGVRRLLEATADKAGEGAVLPIAKVTCMACGEVTTVVTALGGQPRKCLACGADL